MISIFIVNLLRDSGRRRYMCRQLEELGEKHDIEYEFFEAVDKSFLEKKHYDLYDDSAVRKRVGRSLSEGEIACALSHAAVWKLILQRGIDHAVIMEDDAEISDSFIDAINNLTNFPVDWDMLNFCTMAPPISTNVHISPSLEIVQYDRKMSGTVAYCATRKGFTTMLKHVYPLKAAADGLLSSLAIMGHLKCYGTVPQLVKPSENFVSSIWQSANRPENNYCIDPQYIQRYDPQPGSIDSPAISARYQLQVYQAASERYRGGKVLDIGCGIGDKLVGHFNANLTIGLDLPSVVTRTNSRHPDRVWQELDFDHIPHQSFSLIICASTIEEIIDPDKLLEYIEQLDFELCLISTPDRDSLSSGRKGPPENPAHYRQWNQTEFSDYIGSRFKVRNQYLCKEPGYLSQVIEFSKREKSDSRR